MNNLNQDPGLSSVSTTGSARPGGWSTDQYTGSGNKEDLWKYARNNGLSGEQRGQLYSTYGSTNDPSKPGSASDRIAGIIRSEWDDYIQRYQPRDKQLLDIASGNVDNEQAIQRSRESVATGFNTARGSMNRDMSRMGLSSMPDEAQQRDASSGLAQTAAEVSAVNGARIHTQDRDMKLMSGDMSVGLRGNRLQGGA